MKNKKLTFDPHKQYKVPRNRTIIYTFTFVEAVYKAYQQELDARNINIKASNYHFEELRNIIKEFDKKENK